MANDKMFCETLYSEWSLIQKGLNHSGFIKFLYVIPEGEKSHGFEYFYNVFFLTLCGADAFLKFISIFT